jgi:hypothetical protein
VCSHDFFDSLVSVAKVAVAVAVAIIISPWAKIDAYTPPTAIESVTNATSTQPLEKFYRHLLLPAFSRVKEEQRDVSEFPMFQAVFRYD